MTSPESPADDATMWGAPGSGAVLAFHAKIILAIGALAFAYAGFLVWMMFHAAGVTATVTSSGIALRGGGIGGVFFTTLAVLTVAAYTVYAFATTLVVLVLPKRRFVVCMVHGLAIVAAIAIFRA